MISARVEARSARASCSSSAPDRTRPSRKARAALDLLRLWLRRGEERRELAGMSEQEWRDIGLTRIDAMREIRKPFWR